MENTLALDLRPDSPWPLHQQVYEQIRLAILSGRERSRQKLPASRQLAQSLGISRSTVTQSYDQLISEGYLETRRGSGTFVCAQIPDTLLYTKRQLTTLTPSDTQPEAKPDAKTALSHSIPDSLSTYGQRLLKTVTLPTSIEETLSFRYWQPDLSAFPRKQWQRSITRCCAQTDDWMSYSPESMGYEPLRQAIATYITQSRAVHCTPQQILITQGTQQALSLIAKVLLNEGDAIALEDPGYLSARKVLSAHGARTFPISVDKQGRDVDRLDILSRQTIPIKLAYVTPSHQFPTGVLMSLPRRLALLKWAQQTGGFVIEDDYDSAFRYSGRPIPAPQGLDRHQRVLYVGTFSKIMFPGLRLGYIVLPPSLVPAFERAKWVCDRQSYLLNQAALADFISQGHLAKHIRRMRTIYAQRRVKLIELLTELSAPFGNLEIAGDPAGLHFMARLPIPPQRGSGQALKRAAKERGVALFNVVAYRHPQALSAQIEQGQTKQIDIEDFIFGFGGLNDTDLETAINRLRPLSSSSSL